MSAVAPVAQVIQMTPIQMSVEQFKEALPAKVKKAVNAEMVAKVTAMLSDPDLFENYRDNLLGYTSVMADGKFRIDQYINAVKYVSHKLMGCSNIEAYSKTFPDKMTDYHNRNVSSKDISSYVVAFNKSKLVNLIFEQTLIPAYVYNQDMFQKALNVQADLMVNATSEKVRSDAANSLLTHLKQPETSKVKLDIGLTEGAVNTIADLRAATQAFVTEQRKFIESGAGTAKDVAEKRLLIDQDVSDV